MDVQTWVEEDFGRRLRELVPVETGTDTAARLFRGVDDEGARYAVKWTAGGSVAAWSLVTGADSAALVDWDDAVLASRERDLLFLLGGGVLPDAAVTEAQRAAFLTGYGDHEVGRGPARVPPLRSGAGGRPGQRCAVPHGPRRPSPGLSPADRAGAEERTGPRAAS